MDLIAKIRNLEGNGKSAKKINSGHGIAQDNLVLLVGNVTDVQREGDSRSGPGMTRRGPGMTRIGPGMTSIVP